MTPAEAAALLVVAAAYDNRKPDEDAAKAWAMALDGHRFIDCRDALVAYYRTNRNWVMPADVIAGVKRIRDDRMLAFGGLPQPPNGLSDDEYQRWFIDTHRAIADGELTRDNYREPAQVGAGRDIAALGQVGRHVPTEESKARRDSAAARARARIAENRAARKVVEPEPLLHPSDYSREPEPDHTREPEPASTEETK